MDAGCVQSAPSDARSIAELAKHLRESTSNMLENSKKQANARIEAERRKDADLIARAREMTEALRTNSVPQLKMKYKAIELKEQEKMGAIRLEAAKRQVEEEKDALRVKLAKAKEAAEQQSANRQAVEATKVIQARMRAQENQESIAMGKVIAEIQASKAQTAAEQAQLNTVLAGPCAPTSVKPC